MAPSRAALRSIKTICTNCQKQIPARRNLTTTARLADLEESRLPRVANPSLWASLIPKPFRRPTDPVEAAERARIKAARPKGWNPYTFFIFMGVFVGSNAINLIALRNEMLNFNRKTDAKLALLREVIKKVKNGEEVDVKRALGTDDPQQEQEWEEAMKELETTDMLWESKKKKEAQKAERALGMPKKQAREILSPREREGPGREPKIVKNSIDTLQEPRPKFIM